MKKYAVIVAGGVGLRMGSPLPKQFLIIQGKPIIWYTIQTFLRSYRDIHIILVLPADYLLTGLAICQEMNEMDRIECVTGGETRFHSVKNGLALVTEPSVVFVHDAVRCLVTSSLIHACFESAIRYGSAVPGVESKDTVRVIHDNGNSSLNRKSVRLIQTPQTFLSDIILKAYQTEYKEAFTDDASVVEAFGETIHLIEGETNNIKITTPLDMAIAESLIELPKFSV